VRKRKKAKRPVSERVPLQIAQSVNEVWSMDFVSHSLANSWRTKCLTVADDFSHECVDIASTGVVRLQGAGQACIILYWPRMCSVARMLTH
jgi:transposase InsO family protein